MQRWHPEAHRPVPSCRLKGLVIPQSGVWIPIIHATIPALQYGGTEVPPIRQGYIGQQAAVLVSVPSSCVLRRERQCDSSAGNQGCGEEGRLLAVVLGRLSRVYGFRCIHPQQPHALSVSKLQCVAIHSSDADGDVRGIGILADRADGIP